MEEDTPCTTVPSDIYLEIGKAFSRLGRSWMKPRIRHPFGSAAGHGHWKVTWSANMGVPAFFSLPSTASLSMVAALFLIFLFAIYVHLFFPVIICLFMSEWMKPRIRRPFGSATGHGRWKVLVTWPANMDVPAFFSLPSTASLSNMVSGLFFIFLFAMYVHLFFPVIICLFMICTVSVCCIRASLLSRYSVFDVCYFHCYLYMLPSSLHLFYFLCLLFSVPVYVTLFFAFILFLMFRFRLLAVCSPLCPVPLLSFGTFSSLSLTPFPLVIFSDSGNDARKTLHCTGRGGARRPATSSGRLFWLLLDAIHGPQYFLVYFISTDLVNFRHVVH
ncbi:uncharacterized protein LOC115076166 [Rhinatrema bivittatum]|uniref:uncharacterized protein LOC115076166 n=1 Tax=Rhinatrema bivittatum TaxID=194408 RepID=UPI001125BE22|nr:uncharacterized protein LOC115076166 [Rhinatrema bivittatum]